MILVLAVATAGLGALALLWLRNREEPTVADPRRDRLGLPPDRTTPPPPPPGPARTAKPKRKAPPTQPRTVTPKGKPHAAVLRSVLDPEGYAEIDGCLRRVRWEGNGTAPRPGDVVDVFSDGKRRFVVSAGAGETTSGRK